MMNLIEKVELHFGKKGVACLEAGNYLYVGSAFGPGGLPSRLGRYANSIVKRHWHVDDLLAVADVMGALALVDNQRYECNWAHALRTRFQEGPSGFGSSDCKCSSHLFYIGVKWHLEQLEFLSHDLGCESKQVRILNVQQLKERIW